MHVPAVRIVSGLAAAALLIAATPATQPTLLGFSDASSKTERDWEEKFKAIPEPARMRANMQRLTAHPHHVGSPYDKVNAEWLLAQLKSYGLDAHIESFDVLFPTPLERAVELVSPTRFVAKLQSLHSRRTPRRTRRPKHFRRTTPTRSTVTSPRRWSTSTTASPQTTRSSRATTSP